VEERHLSLSEVAQLLDKSERTIRRWIKSGKLRAYKPGRDYLIPESGIREFIEGSEVHPKVEAPPSLEPSFNDVLEEERREATSGLRLQLLRELEQHIEHLTNRFRRESSLLDQEGDLEAFEELLRDALFACTGAMYMLKDNQEEVRASGHESEPERRARVRAERAVTTLNTICDDIEAKTEAAREAEGQNGDAGIRALDAYRKRAG
jgi:excisionase family DNA binding protein